MLYRRLATALDTVALASYLGVQPKAGTCSLVSDSNIC
jgi:hypothetical protein